MEITREELLRKVAEESGFYQKHVRTVFNAIEKVVLDLKGQEYPEPVKMPGDKKPATWNFD